MKNLLKTKVPHLYITQRVLVCVCMCVYTDICICVYYISESVCRSVCLYVHMFTLNQSCVHRVCMCVYVYMQGSIYQGYNYIVFINEDYNIIII